MKKIFTLFAALAMVLSMFAVNMKGGEELYLTPNANWLQVDGAGKTPRFAIYVYGTGDAWASMTAVEGETNLYKAVVPTGNWTNVIFVRMNGGTTANNWNNKYNQTSNLVYNGTQNWYAVKENTWDKGGGTWKLYAPEAPKSYKDITITIVANATPKIHYWEGGDKVVGTEWDAKPDMVATGEENTYSYTIKEVDEATGVKYLVVVGEVQSADQQAFEDVTINFKELLPQVAVMGVTSWDGDKMTVADDYLSASITLPLEATKDYNIKLTVNGDWFGSNAITITKDNNSAKFDTNGEGNGKLTTDLAGDYVFTYTYATKTLAVTYPVPPVTKYTVTLSDNTGGFEPLTSGAGEYEEGEEVTVTASEDLEGWVFIGWTEDGEFVANDPEYTFVVKGDVELVAVYAMDLGENEVTDLVIDGDNMLLTGSVAGFPMGTMNLELALGEYDDEEGVFLLTEESKLYVGETNFTFVDGMATVDMNTNSAMAIVVFEHNGAYYYMTVNMSKKIEATVIEIDNATVTIEERSMGFGDEVYHVLKMESTWSDGETTYPVFLETTEFDQTKESQEVAASITVGGMGDEDPWLGNAEGDVTITVADGKVTVEGLLENAYAWPAPVAFDVTISGKLPVVEPTTITYDLNGGEIPAVVVPTNEELWEAFKPYYNTYYGLARDLSHPIANVTTFAHAKMQEIMTDPASEYKWLGDYVLQVTTAAGRAIDTEVLWRFGVAAFFNCKAEATSTWNGNADFTEAGKPENWGPAYQAANALVLPTEPVAEDYTLPVPTKEGYTFVGWYDNAAGEGEAYKVIPAGWAGTLYAIWKTNGPTTALDNIAVEGKAVKAIINGQLIIIKNGVQYNAQGVILK